MKASTTITLALLGLCLGIHTMYGMEESQSSTEEESNPLYALALSKLFISLIR